MFPVHTGINRGIFDYIVEENNVPCAHRDKPLNIYVRVGYHIMFPVHTGINRTISYFFILLSNVPCAHRDKPCKTEF